MNFKSVSTIILSSAFVLGLTQCNSNQQTDNASSNQTQVATACSLKIAYIDVDTLLRNYDFYQDLTDEFIRKEESYSLILENEKEKIEKDVADYNDKIEKNIYSSVERAESEKNRINRRTRSYTEMVDKYSLELESLSKLNNQKISEAIDAYLKEYNKDHGYNIILNKASILLADPGMDITKEFTEGLNAAYNKPSDK